MPVVQIQGIPEKYKNTDGLDRMAYRVRKAVTSVKELEITKDQVTVFFPSDLLPQSGSEIIAEIQGLYKKPERTPEVLRTLRQNVAEALNAGLFSISVGKELLIEVRMGIMYEPNEVEVIHYK